MPIDLIARLSHHARHRPARIALRQGDHTLSYAELATQVAIAAAHLCALGLTPGDRLVVWANKRIESVVLILAAWSAGIVIVPLHPALRAGQLRDIFDRAHAHGLIIDASHAKILGFTAIAQHDLGFTPQPTQSPVAFELKAALGEAALNLTHQPQPSDLAALLYTSGSTGQPKGVMVTRGNLNHGAAAVRDYLGLTTADELLAVLPLSFDYGLSQITTALMAGAGVTLLNYLLPNDLKKPLLTGGITVLAGTPGLLIPLAIGTAHQTWLTDAPHLRLITNSGGKLPVATVHALRAARPQTDLYLMYGLTEAFRASFLPPAEVDAHPDSIGRAFSATVLALVDAHGQLLPEGEAEGELVQGGVLVTAGYFNDAVATAECFRVPPTGWPNPEDRRVVFSGDRVRRDRDGRLYFLGRRDEQIKTQGYRVSPEEIEAEALRYPGVVEALAFGFAPADAPENTRIGLVIAPETVAINALHPWLQARLAPYQMPKHTLALPVLPRSNNGKLDRSASRAIFLKQFPSPFQAN